MPSRLGRAAFALVVALASGGFTALIAKNTAAWYVSDFDQTWQAARLLRQGGDPYTVIGDGSDPRWKFRYFYPMPAAVAALPIARLSVFTARVLFATVSGALFAWAVTRDRWLPAVAVLSHGFAMSVYLVQWTPLVVASVTLPWLGFVLACKPNVAAMALSGSSNWRAAALALAIAGAFTLLTIVYDPGWPLRWRDALRTAEHFRPFVFRPGGALLLLALLRWRVPQARILAALAFVPHTPGTREILLFFAAPVTRLQAALLVLGSWAADHALDGRDWWSDSFVLYASASAKWMLLLVYLPVLITVLVQPNRGTMPVVIERLAGRLPRWLRGENLARPADGLPAR